MLTYLSSLQSQIDQFHDLVKSHQTFLIIGHSNPDGDCLGSMLGLGRWLEKQGKEVRYTASRQHSPSLNRVWWSDRISYVTNNPWYTRFDSDVIICIDHSSYSQRSDAQSYFQEHITNQIIVCIDHHLDASIVCQYSLIDTSASSATELLRELLNYLDPHKEYIDSTIASLCYLGLVTDTWWSWWFMREKNSIRSFENALSMIKAWAEKPLIINKLNTLTQNDIEFIKLCFTKIQYFEHGIWYVVSEEERLQFGLDAENLHRFSSIIKKIENQDVIVCFTLIEGKVYGSIRTTNAINVQRIAKAFGGWWHLLASGFRLTDQVYTPELIASQIIPRINELLDQQVSPE